MSKEKKKESYRKIESFDIMSEDILDPEMDELLRTECRKEADALEERLNHDPKLVGIGASDDLFTAIVGELKQKGIWEEEPESDRGESEPEEETEKAEKTEDNSLERLYQMLPEADQKALALGKKLQEKEQKRLQKQKKRTKQYRLAGAAAAVIVIVGGIGISTEANRKVALQAWNAVAESFGFRTVTNSVEGQMVARSMSKEESKAYAEISEKLGIGGIDFAYMPEGMEYERYVCDPNMWQATVFYSYENNVVSIQIANATKEGVSYLSMSDQAEKIDFFYGKQKTEMEIWKNNSRETEYVGETEYEGWRCIINGKIEIEELKKIMEEMYFL